MAGAGVNGRRILMYGLYSVAGMSLSTFRRRGNTCQPIDAAVIQQLYFRRRRCHHARRLILHAFGMTASR